MIGLIVEILKLIFPRDGQISFMEFLRGYGTIEAVIGAFPKEKIKLRPSLVKEKLINPRLFLK